MRRSLTSILLSLAAAPLAAQTPYGWTMVASTGPPSRAGHAMVYDSTRARTVMFGGAGQWYGVLFQDTWEWDGLTWTQVAATGPAPRDGHAMSFDVARGRTVLFGGWDQYSPPGITFFGDTWEWDGAAWMQVATAGPAARAGHALAFDSRRHKTVLFGGWQNGANFFGDTWEWDGAAWSQVASTGPQARESHAMAFDSRSRKTVVLGGYSAAALVDDLWEWDGAVWTRIYVAPIALTGPTMVDDSQRGCLEIFNGDNATLEWNGASLTLVNNLSGPFGGSAMVYDSLRGRSVLFGRRGHPQPYFSETWELNGGHTSTTVPFGTGCGNPALGLLGFQFGRPSIQTTALAFLTDIPSSLAGVALGWSNTTLSGSPLPLPMAGLGLPGCNLLQSAEYLALPVAFTGPSTATFSLLVPNISGLIGLHVYLQGWAHAPGANPAQTIVSNGLEWVVGDW